MAGMTMTVTGDKEMVARLNDISSLITNQIPKMVSEKVTRYGQLAGEQFMSADYDGNNDVVVSVETPDDHTWNIVASGTATLFLEYGSGIIFRHDSQFGDFAAYGRKSWSVGPQGKGFLIGKKLATWKGWWPLPKDVFGEHGWATAGNPSVSAMYEASKTARYELPIEIQMQLEKVLR